MNRRWLALGGALLTLLFLALVVVLVIPRMVKARLAETLDATLNEALLATVHTGELEVSLIRSFPLLQIRMHDFTITSQGEFAGVQLLRVGQLDLGLDLRSVLFGDTVTIERVAVHRPWLDMRVAADGSSNLDLFPPEDVTEQPETGPFTVRLDAFEVSELDLRYTDAQSDLEVVMVGLATTGTGTIEDDVSTLQTHVDIEALSVRDGGTTWLRDTTWDADVALDLNMATGAVTLLDNRISVNALALQLAGSVTPQGDDTALDLQLSSTDSAFKSLLSLVPDAYSDSFDGVSSQGTLSLTGTVAGTYPASGEELPGFDLDVTVADAAFKYPDAPVGIDDIALQMEVRHPQGPSDLTRITIDRFSLAAGNTPLTGSLRMETPVTDPQLDLTAKGRIDLDELRRAIPAAEGTSALKGRLDVDLRIAGRMSDFEAQRTDRITAKGVVEGAGLVYRDPEWPVPFDVPAVDLVLNTNQAQIRQLDLGWEGSDLSVQGTLDNVLPYLLADGVLRGNLLLTSRQLDLRPFQGEESSAADPDAEGVVMPVPENLDLVGTATFGTVETESFTFRSLNGRMTARDQVLTLRNVRAEMLGGEMRLEGTYTAVTPDHADVDVQMSTVRFDLADTVREFEMLARIAPLLEGAEGSFDSDIALTTRLQADGTPEYPRLSSKGSFTTRSLEVAPSPLITAAKALNNRRLSKVDVSGQKIRYAIDNGRMRVRPFTAKLGGVAATIKGSTSLVSDTMKLQIDLPLPADGLKATGLLGAFGERLPSVVDVRIELTGSFDDPDVKVGLVGEPLKEAVEEGLKDALGGLAGKVLDATGTPGTAEEATDPVQAARDKGDALLAEARTQAAALRTEASQAASKLRQDAAAQGAKLVSDAKGNPV
ncbi:MAG: hypothetical protein KTR31_22780, partial [Myxococcales bacterium]|nr:hypothetical protein [Myxococcales bacterium]